MVSGRVHQFIDRLEGSGGNKEFSWVVIGNKGETVNLTLGSPMTGVVVKDIRLQ
jgi:hypothetical protein